MMRNSDQVPNYLDIFKFRQSASRRDVIIMSAVFLISFISMLIIGLVLGLGNREVYLVAALNVVFGITFVMAWVRLEIITSTIDLLNNLQARD